MALTAYRIPICPFCQRLEILLELKGLQDAVAFETVDVTGARSPRLLALTDGSTALPVLELEDGRALRESLVLLDYLEARFPHPPVRRVDPYERAVENLLATLADDFIASGYRLVMNQDRDQREALVTDYLAQWAGLGTFLERHGSSEPPWLFDRFGWAETVYTPFFQRFAFVRYYEDVDLPAEPRFQRVRAWREACVAHPAAQQTCDEEIVKLYYDYARGAGDGALPNGRTRSSFAFEPGWRARPLPPRDKYGPGATDAALGLVLPANP